MKDYKLTIEDGVITWVENADENGEYSAKVEHPYRFELNSAAAQIEQSNRRN